MEIYIIKRDIRIYVTNSRPNGWTEWAEIFCEHSGVAGWCFRLKNRIFFNIFFFPLALQLVLCIHVKFEFLKFTLSQLIMQTFMQTELFLRFRSNQNQSELLDPIVDPRGDHGVKKAQV